MHPGRARCCNSAGRPRRSPASPAGSTRPGDRPLTLAGLRGRVVLVDFWTYSCINCQRTLPHVEAWNRSYAKDGLTIVGVHTPEFAFEHVRVQRGPGGRPARGATTRSPWTTTTPPGTPTRTTTGRPSTWSTPPGTVRHVDFGEGEYARPSRSSANCWWRPTRRRLPPAAPTCPTARRPGRPRPESYLGYQHREPTWPGRPWRRTGWPPTRRRRPSRPTSTPTAATGRSAERPRPGRGPPCRCNFEAKDVYLVLGGAGTVVFGRRATDPDGHGGRGAPALPAGRRPDASRRSSPGRVPRRAGLRLHLRLSRTAARPCRRSDTGAQNPAAGELFTCRLP